MKINFFQDNGVFDSRATGPGVYQFKIGLEGDDYEDYLSLYIGESFSMIVRCGQHIYEVFEKDPSYFGLSPEHIENDDLELVVEVYKSIEIPEGTSYSERDRKLGEHELEAIKKMKPLSQFETSDRLRKDRVEVVGDAISKLLEKRQ